MRDNIPGETKIDTYARVGPTCSLYQPLNRVRNRKGRPGPSSRMRARRVYIGFITTVLLFSRVNVIKFLTT